ncbi:ANTAR domain-containing protein [Streptomyces flavidovirens]|uniref:ANTAR domain-containing protein n=1 Tax=Streptomyces flavidovirens TaxID=67298 RepID=UPI0003F9056E|nr:ANTAR domain-containing protein [Streptomyces flavidovirens]
MGADPAERTANPDVTGELRGAPPHAHRLEAETQAQMRAEITQLRQALSSRTVIGQAQGMLMALAACSADEAWDVLVEVSQRTNIKLREVAAALVAAAGGNELPASVRVPLRQSVRRVRNAG